MSTHTTIKSNIYHVNDLIRVLDEMGISWERLQRIPKWRTYSSGEAHCVIEAQMNGESVIIYQDSPGKPFVFQSQGASFRNHSNATGLALNSQEQIARKKEEERERREEQARQEQYKRLCEKMATTSTEEGWRTLALEFRQMKGYQNATDLANECEKRYQEEKRIREIAKIAKEEGIRKLAEEQDEKQEKQRLQELERQAADALQRLEAEKAAKRQERGKPTVSPPSHLDGGGASLPAALDSVIGKLHQQNALRKILESLETLDRDTGLSLYSQDILEDETIELTLRG